MHNICMKGSLYIVFHYANVQEKNIGRQKRKWMWKSDLDGSCQKAFEWGAQSLTVSFKLQWMQLPILLSLIQTEHDDGHFVRV